MTERSEVNLEIIQLRFIIYIVVFNGDINKSAV